MSTLYKNIAVYLGSSGYCRPIFKQSTQEIAALLAKKDKALIYGGMDAGLMGILAQSAIENNANVTGIIPQELEDSKRIHPGLNETVLVNSLYERKLSMFMKMDAAITLPGGFGTIDEMMEILYWAHLGLHTKPLILVNVDEYYNEFITFLKTLPDLPHEKQLIIVNTPKEAFEKIEKLPAQSKIPDSTVFPHFEDIILQNTEEPIIIEKASVKDIYLLSTALGLKQLQRHERAIGVLNKDGQYNDFLKWISRAQKETFITKHCTRLFDTDKNLDHLKETLKQQIHIKIDLTLDKWGEIEE